MTRLLKTFAAHSLLYRFARGLWRRLRQRLGHFSARRKAPSKLEMRLQLLGLAQDAEAEEMRERLREALDDERLATRALYAYWSRRYLGWRIGLHCGVPFRQYLRRPFYYEGVAAGRAALVRHRRKREGPAAARAKVFRN